MFTFSQMVDAIVLEARRPDLASEIARYVNQTIRECHFSTDRQAAIFYRENFNELSVQATTESAYTWTPPNPTTFQGMAAVQYPGVFDIRGNPVWPKQTVPGRHLADLTEYFYQVGSSFVFSGYGGLNAYIALGYFAFPASLKYYSEAQRPAIYDAESGWTYRDDIDGDAELEEAARLVTTNWLLMRWSDVVSEGVRAKLYKRVSDTERARNCYSLYGQLRQGLMTSEVADVGGPR